jgi:hypothetical protein
MVGYLIGFKDASRKRGVPKARKPLPPPPRNK